MDGRWLEGFCGFVVAGWGMGVGKKYFWMRAEEARLVELWRRGIRDFKVLGKELGRTPRATEMKLQRLGVVEGERKISSTTTAVKSRDLFTHEETLKILAGALEALREPGLHRLELQHLRILADIAQTYDGVLEKFERWVEIERRLLEMDKEIEELQKTYQVQSEFSRVQT